MCKEIMEAPIFLEGGLILISRLSSCGIEQQAYVLKGLI